MIARLHKRKQSLLPAITRQRVDRYHTRVAGDVHPNMKSGMSGAQVLWQEQGPPLGDDGDLPLPVRVPCRFSQLAPSIRAPTIPFCQTVSQAGSAHPGPGINQFQYHAKTSELQAAARKKRVILAIPKMDPSPHQASSWSALPGGLQGGWWVWTVPMGPPKTEKKS